MQFMALFARHGEKADAPAPADLREAEFEMLRGFYADGLVPDSKAHRSSSLSMPLLCTWDSQLERHWVLSS
jgi:hypothetical protein